MLNKRTSDESDSTQLKPLVESIRTGGLLLMPGLAPGIHVLAELRSKTWDGRNKSGHDRSAFYVGVRCFPNASTCRSSLRRTIQNSSTVSKASDIEVAAAAPWPP